MYTAEAHLIFRTRRQVVHDLEVVRRDLASVGAASSSGKRLTAESVRLGAKEAHLRAEYKLLVDSARAQQRPEPPA